MAVGQIADLVADCTKRSRLALLDAQRSTVQADQSYWHGNAVAWADAADRLFAIGNELAK